MSVTLKITKADVTEFPAPELAKAGITDPQWKLLIEAAQMEMSSSLGDQAKIDRCGRYLVAHMATLLWQARKGVKASGGAAGPLTGVTVGPVSKTFAVPEAWQKAALTAAVLSTTRYGQEYLRLIRIFLGGSATVSGGLGPVSGWNGGGVW